MHIVKANALVYTPLTMDLLKQIELAGRTCYKSEDKITDSSCIAFVRMLIKNGHEAMLEHADVSVLFTCDRGVTHEIARHRIASLAQESTRYCNYSKSKFGNNVTYTDLRTSMVLDSKPYTAEQMIDIYTEWVAACADAERHYFRMLSLGASAQIARSVLNNSTKADLVLKANIREWRHFLKLRCAPDAHPAMREVAYSVLMDFRNNLPVLVEDIPYQISMEG